MCDCIGNVGATPSVVDPEVLLLEVVPRDPGTPRVAKVEGPVVAPSDSYTALDIDGEGLLTSMFMTTRCIDGFGQNDTKVQVYVDGELTPSIDVALVDLTASRSINPVTATSSLQTRFYNDRIGYMANAFNEGISYTMFWAVPFKTHVKVVFVNGSATNPTILGGYLEYSLRPIDMGRYGKLHIQPLNLSCVPYVETDLLVIPATVKGAFYGFYGHFLGGDSNYNYLEGNVKMYVDGAAANEYDSTEDYFTFGWYAWAANLDPRPTTSRYGCTFKRDAVPGLIGLYRFHEPAPVAFDSDFRLTWAAGELASGQPVVNNVELKGSLWWYTES